jgi:hypothetical protein
VSVSEEESERVRVSAVRLSCEPRDGAG